jgi:hypothetical protein
MMSFKQMFSFSNMGNLAQSKFQMSIEDSIAMFGCGCLTFAIFMQIFKRTKKSYMEKELSRQQEILREANDEHEKEMEKLAECYRIIRKMDLGKIKELESRCSDLLCAYRELEAKHNDLLSWYNHSTSGVSDSTLQEDEDLTSQTSDITESEEHEEIVEIQEVGRRTWTNKEKSDGTYQHELPDGLKIHMKSVKCKKTLSLTFRKAEQKENDIWIENETEKQHKNLNKARAAFFGEELTSKQSVWLCFRSEDGKTLRDIIEN